ncbi:hypothetical protein MASR1M32_41750 [Rhodobacter sp.]
MPIRMTTVTTTNLTTGTIMLDDFLVRAALAGVGVALATGPLGAFVVWRRMAYFGDATAHAAILGVALALATDLPIVAGTLVVALAMAVTVAGLAARGWTLDTTLGVMAHSALAFGLVAVSFLPQVRTDLSASAFRRHSGRVEGRSCADLGRGRAGRSPSGLALAGASGRHAERGSGPFRRHPPRA